MHSLLAAVCVVGVLVLGVSRGVNVSDEHVQVQAGAGANLVEGDAVKVKSGSTESDLIETNLIDGQIGEDFPLFNQSTDGMFIEFDVRCGKLSCSRAEEVESGDQPTYCSYRVEGSDTEPSLMVKVTCNPDVGERLMLTPMLEAGNITEARDLARVIGGPFPDHIPSYSGFFTVDKRFNSNLFFWFFPCETAYETAPVLLWLQGGPGDSSLLGLFNEMGPFTVAAGGRTLIDNPNSWHKDHSIIFIDNPVGAGFSYTEAEEGYATNQTQIGESLYCALVQFFTLFPHLQKNDFFLTGLSYAGKYIPTLGHIIHMRNPNAELKINLKGIAVGNGYTDPVSMTDLSTMVYQMGLVDSDVRDQMEILEREARQAVEDGDMLTAAGKINLHVQLFSRSACFDYGYNLLHSREPYKEYGFAAFLRSADVRMRLHVADLEYTTASVKEGTTKVSTALYPQRMVTVKPYLEELLEHYRVLYYSGQLDLAVTYPMSVKMYQSLNWSAREEYHQAQRIPWFVNGDLAGYMKSAGKFTEVLVRNAGHVVVYDQPVWARNLITLFTSDKIKNNTKCYRFYS